MFHLANVAKITSHVCAISQTIQDCSRKVRLESEGQYAKGW